MCVCEYILIYSHSIFKFLNLSPNIFLLPNSSFYPLNSK